MLKKRIFVLYKVEILFLVVFFLFCVLDFQNKIYYYIQNMETVSMVRNEGGRNDT